METAKERAAEFFTKNPDVDHVYATADGNIFRAEHYASNWSKNFKDNKVETIFRDGKTEEKTVIETLIGQLTDGNVGVVITAAIDDKATLVKRFIELFDKKPNHMLGIEKLKLQIAEKEAELAKEAKASNAGANAGDTGAGADNTEAGI